MYICTYVHLYICTYVCIDIHTYVYVYICIYLYIQMQMYIYKGISLQSGVIPIQLGVEGGCCCFFAAPCSSFFWIKHVTFAIAPHRRPGYVGLTQSLNLLTWLHFAELAGDQWECSVAFFNCKARWAFGWSFLEYGIWCAQWR